MPAPRKPRRLGFLVKFPSPNPEQPPSPCLSRAHGGEASCGKSYCVMYAHRPLYRSMMLLCSGGGIWPACADYHLCLRVRARSIWLRKGEKAPGEPEDFDIAANKPQTKYEEPETNRPVVYIEDPMDLDFDA